MRRLRRRIALLVGTVVGGVIVVTSTAGVLSTDRVLHERLDAQLRSSAEVSARAAERIPAVRSGAAGMIQRRPRLLSGTGFAVRVVAGGRQVAAAGDLPGRSVPTTTPLGRGVTIDAGARWRVWSARSREPGLGVQVLARLEPVEEAAAAVRRRAMLLGSVGLLLGVAGAWWIAGITVRPLERALTAARRFAGDAGHELRTPLTTATANVDTVLRHPAMAPDRRDEILRDTLAEQERLAGMVRALQTLARLEGGTAEDPADLVAVTDEAVVALAQRHRDIDVRWMPGAPEAIVHGSAATLELAVSNLLENAVRHGGRVVQVGVACAGRDAVLTVDDDGPGIPADERERVFRRFERGGSAPAEGLGVGLSIVAAVAERLGGAVRIEDGPLGGARFVLRLRRDALRTS